VTARRVPEDEVPAATEASFEVVLKTEDAGGRVFGGGTDRRRASAVAADGP